MPIYIIVFDEGNLYLANEEPTQALLNDENIILIKFTPNKGDYVFETYSHTLKEWVTITR